MKFLTLRYSLVLAIAIASLMAALSMADNKPKSYYARNSVHVLADKAAKKYGLDPKLVKAIIAHESWNCKVMVGETGDIGCMQIKPSTALAMNMDIVRLQTDRAYSIEQGARVLAWFKRTYGRKEPRTWYCRYNVGTGTLEGRLGQLCAKYIHRVAYSH